MEVCVTKVEEISPKLKRVGPEKVDGSEGAESESGGRLV